MHKPSITDSIRRQANYNANLAEEILHSRNVLPRTVPGPYRPIAGRVTTPHKSANSK